MADYIPRILINTGLNKLDVKSPEKDGLDGWEVVAPYSIELRDDGGVPYLGMENGRSGRFVQRVPFNNAQKNLLSKDSSARVVLRWSSKSTRPWVTVRGGNGWSYQERAVGPSGDFREYELALPRVVTVNSEYLEVEVWIPNNLGAGVDASGVGVTRFSAEIITDE